LSERQYITCKQLIEFIADYVDGQLDEVSRSDFERHLAVCKSCQTYLEMYRQTVTAVRALAPDEPLDDIPEELVRSILTRRR
jgi:anti-sigma factor RsiW